MAVKAHQTSAAAWLPAPLRHTNATWAQRCATRYAMSGVEQHGQHPRALKMQSRHFTQLPRPTWVCWATTCAPEHRHELMDKDLTG